MSNARSLIQHVCLLLLLSAGAVVAEDRALVLDGKGQALLAVDLRTGAVTQRVPTAGVPSLVLRSGDGARLALLDHGPYKQTVCCHLQPKGPMIATLQTFITGAPPRLWVMPMVGFFNWRAPARP